MAAKAEKEEVAKYAAQLLEFRKELDLKMETVRELAERKGRMEVKRDVSADDKESSAEKLKAAAAPPMVAKACISSSATRRARPPAWRSRTASPSSC